MSLLVRVVDEHVGGVAVVTIEGEIDASNVRDVAERVRTAVTNHSHALVVDLAETSYIDSAGINALFALHIELRQRRQQLHLVVRPGSPIVRVIGITGLEQTVATHPSRFAALEATAPA